MVDLTCPKLRVMDGALLHRWLKLPPEHAGLIDDLAPVPASLLARLRSLNLWDQALRHLAYGLPEREAVWWSCMCVRFTGGKLPEAEAKAVLATEAWVRQPSPATRQESAMAASAAGYAAPGAWAALGATWSHRKRFLPDLCGGRGAAMAVDRAANRNTSEPELLAARRHAFFNAGVDISRGGAGRLPAELMPDHEVA
jgi:hypothetical protein